MIGDCLKRQYFSHIKSSKIISHVRLSVLSVPEIFIKHCTLYNKWSFVMNVWCYEYTIIESLIVLVSCSG